MSGKCRPSLRAKTLENVKRCNLSETDKDCIEAVFKEFERLKAEFETEIDKLNAEKNDVMYYKDQIKAEAVKEFAERLKKEIDIRPTHSREQNKYVFFLIDNLVKEMVGEG